MSETILELRGISKQFPGIKALDQVDLTIRTGEVHALIGENGAGKSTLVKVLTGVHAPTDGTILLRGETVSFNNAVEAQTAGIAAIHQEASMFPELSVMENIFMGHHIQNGAAKKLDWAAMRRKTMDLLQSIELKISPDTLIKDLGAAQRHMVEIAKALSVNAEIVIMDEPSSALSTREVEDLYKIVRQLREEGKAIIFISHKFDEIYEICDYFTVLRDGAYIGEGRLEEYSIDQIIQMMVGRSLNQMFPKQDAEIHETVLEAIGLTRRGFFKNISFDLRRGEILGFFGLVGAGRSELMRAIFGIDALDEGELKLFDSSYVPTSPKHAMDEGIAYVPEDRQTQGIILDMSLKHNISLPQIDQLSTLGYLHAKKEAELADSFGSRMEVKSPNWIVSANTLSGGNQQKVVLAKWLATDPKILILDEPTKGIDVGTKAAVHQLISQMAVAGLAVILISSEMPEVMGMADRIVVMHEGEKTAEFSREEANPDDIMKAATGHSAGEREVG